MFLMTYTFFELICSTLSVYGCNRHSIEVVVEVEKYVALRTDTV